MPAGSQSCRLDELRTAAQSARAMHWGPYSKFLVLAAVETVDGRVYGGSNVECANFTLTKHAEEGAISAALHDGALARCGRQWLQAVYIAGAIPPCGGCRQFIHEFAADDAVVVLDGEATEYVPLTRLLPGAFGPAHLGIT